MTDVVARNGREALIKTVSSVYLYGREVAPRGLPTRELEHFSLTIEDPTDVLCTGIGANQSKRVLAAETLQVVGGFSDVPFAVEHVPALAAFVNERTGQFDGAYGPRVGPQYFDLEARLRKDRDTRQAILSVWNAGDLARPESKDYPCTLNLGFAIRDGRLNLNVVMRSNDVNWGLKNDLFVFTQLQLSVARVLELEPGVYRHTAFSMHLYDRDREWAEDLLLFEGYDFDRVPDHPLGISGVTTGDMMQRATIIAEGELPPDPTPSERWYAEALAG